MCLPGTCLCPKHHFRYTAGGCLPINFVCDGEMNCKDGSDELCVIKQGYYIWSKEIRDKSLAKQGKTMCRICVSIRGMYSTQACQWFHGRLPKSTSIRWRSMSKITLQQWTLCVQRSPADPLWSGVIDLLFTCKFLFVWLRPIWNYATVQEWGTPRELCCNKLH